MHSTPLFSTFFSLFVSGAFALASPLAVVETKTALVWNGNNMVNVTYENAPASSLAARDSINCKGSSYCGGLDVAQCDEAKNSIVPSNQYNSITGGVCNGSCGILLQNFGNPNTCEYNGGDLINDYNAIRDHGCQKCGSYEYGNGCEVTINYVSHCS